REAFDLGHAVTDFADDADVGLVNGAGHVGDLLFEFLEDAAHFPVIGLKVGMGSVRENQKAWARRSRRPLTVPSHTSLPTRTRRPPRRAGSIWYSKVRESPYLATRPAATRWRAASSSAV